MSMTKPLFHIPGTTLGVAHGPGNTEGPWRFDRRPKRCFTPLSREERKVAKYIKFARIEAQ
jgi:hypothetical protein